MLIGWTLVASERSQVRVLREGDADSELWEQLLLDEPDAGPQPSQPLPPEVSGDQGAATKQGGFGLAQFLEHVAAEAAAQLAADAGKAGHA